METPFFSEDYLAHYGRSKRDGAPHGSGRYPLGSGARPRAGKKAGGIYPIVTRADPWDWTPAISKKGYEKKAEKHEGLVSKFQNKAEKTSSSNRANFYNERAFREHERAESYRNASKAVSDKTYDRWVRRAQTLDTEVYNETVNDIITGEKTTRGKRAIQNFMTGGAHRATVVSTNADNAMIAYPISVGAQVLKYVFKR